MSYVPRKTSRFFNGGTLAEARSVLRERPRAYDPDLADVIVDMVACGEVLTDICLDRDMPLPHTFLQWCREDAALGERYRDALEHGTDVTFDEALSAAHDTDVARGSVRWRALMTRAERQMPEKYGPRATLRNATAKEDESGGIDYAGDVRRRLAAMAERLSAAPAPVEAKED